MNLGITHMGNEHYNRQVAQSCRYAKTDAVFPVRSACVVTQEKRQGYDDKNGDIGGEVKFCHGFYGGDYKNQDKDGHRDAKKPFQYALKKLSHKISSQDFDL